MPDASDTTHGKGHDMNDIPTPQNLSLIHI